jgi:thiol-disulfide isomerase/thioredoxin
VVPQAIPNKNKPIEISYENPTPIIESHENSALNTKKPIVAIIHASWCPHCISVMEPENDSIWHHVKQGCEPQYSVQAYESSDPNTQTFIDDNKVVANVYPTIFKKLSDESSPEYYNGERTAEKIIAWVKGGQTGGAKKSILKKTTKSKKNKTAKKQIKQNKTAKKRVCWLF